MLSLAVSLAYSSIQMLQMNEEKRYYGNDMLAVAEPWKVMLFDAQ
jgi:hypothetical protein